MSEQSIVTTRPNGQAVLTAVPAESRVAIMRPARAKVAELCAPHVEAAIQMLADIVAAKVEGVDVVRLFEIKTTDRIAAAKLILEYGAGKPIQMIEGSGDEGEHIVKVQYV